MVALTNKTQTMLSFLRIFKFNAVICLNSIKEPNVPKIYPKDKTLHDIFILYLYYLFGQNIVFVPTLYMSFVFRP